MYCYSAVVGYGMLRTFNRLCNKMLSYRRETALQGTLFLAKSERLELGDNILLTLYVCLQPL